MTVQRMPYELCSSHDPNSAIWHGGTGAWVNGGKGNPDNLLEKVKKLRNEASIDTKSDLDRK